MRGRTEGLTSDRDWIVTLYDEHGGPLFRYALMLLADRTAAEDVLQQAFAAVAAVRARGVSISSPANYLRSTVRNECYTALRRRNRDAVRLAAAGHQLLDVRAGQVVDPGDRLALSRGIAELPNEQREVIHLKVFEGRTFAEIGRMLGVSQNTAASRYRYAIEHLRQAMADRRP